VTVIGVRRVSRACHLIKATVGGVSRMSGDCHLIKVTVAGVSRVSGDCHLIKVTVIGVRRMSRDRRFIKATVGGVSRVSGDRRLIKATVGGEFAAEFVPRGATGAVSACRILRGGMRGGIMYSSDRPGAGYYEDEIRRHRDAIRALKRARAAALPRRYSAGEEIFSAVTHGIGAALAAAALVALVARASSVAPEDGRAFCVAGFSVFGASMVLLFLMSSLYHALTHYDAKRLFAVFDHSSIYLLIAGTYTAVCLSVLRGRLGWILFGIVWALAVAGIALYSVFGSRMRRISLFTYIPMGWLIVLAGKPALSAIPPESMKYLFAGGAFYTIGSIFYALKKIRWTHCVWHLFVLAGAGAHFFSAMRMV
jgi:hemolysin III